MSSKPTKTNKRGNPNISKIGKRFTSETARAAGKRSGEVRRENIIFANLIAQRLGAKDAEEIVDNLITRSKEKSNDFETMRDTLGQNPKTQVNITTDAKEFEFSFTYNK